MPLPVGAVAGATTLIKSGAVRQVFDSVGGFLTSIFGLSRKQKRNRRDDALAYLYENGMDRSITLSNSDHFKLVQGLRELHAEFGDVVTRTVTRELGPGGIISPDNIEQIVDAIEENVSRQHQPTAVQGVQPGGRTVGGVDPGSEPQRLAATAAAPGLNMALIGTGAVIAIIVLIFAFQGRG